MALRLAKFNVQNEAVPHAEESKRPYYFRGLPCPAAAALVTSTIWVCEIHGYQSRNFSIAEVVIMLLTSYLMVSNIPFRGFKEFDLKKSIRFTYMALIIFILAGIWWRPAEALFFLFALFALSGPFFALTRLIKKKCK